MEAEGDYCSVPAHEGFAFNSQPRDVQPGQTHEAKAWVVGFAGEFGCALMALIFLDESGREIRREIAVVEDFSGRAKLYTIRAEAPARARQALVAYRVNRELPSDCEPAAAKLWLGTPELTPLSEPGADGTTFSARAPSASEATRPRFGVKPGLTPGELLGKISQVKHWYHRMEVHPGIITPGTDDPYPVLARLELPEDCSGLRVLDLGARDGFFSFTLEQHGAKEVIALDHVPPEQTGFHVLQEIFDSKVKFFTENVYNLSPEKYGKFDIVLCLGLLYHLRNPLLALDRIRAVCLDKLYVESHVIDYALRNLGEAAPRSELLRLPLMRFYPREELAGDGTNWWGPNTVCLREMLEATNFTVLSQETYGDRSLLRCAINDDPKAAYFRNLEKGLFPET